MTTITPAAVAKIGLCLRQAEALPQDGPDFLMVRELITALKELVTIATPKEDLI